MRRDYQKLLEIAKRMEAIEAIRRGLKERRRRTNNLPGSFSIRRCDRPMAYLIQAAPCQAEAEVMETFAWKSQDLTGRGIPAVRRPSGRAAVAGGSAETLARVAPENDVFSEEVRHLLYGRRSNTYLDRLHRARRHSVCPLHPSRAAEAVIAGRLGGRPGWRRGRGGLGRTPRSVLPHLRRGPQPGRGQRAGPPLRPAPGRAQGVITTANSFHAGPPLQGEGRRFTCWSWSSWSWS